MKRHAVLLRAVNVGGTGKLPMADFKALLSGLDFEAPQTLGAAGSAVIGTDAAAATVEAQLEAALKDSFGLATEVFVRDHEALKATLAANPFADMARDRPSALLVLFLKGEPAAPDVEALRARIVGPEAVHPGPRSLYIAYGAGMGTSKLTGQVIERALGLRGTSRNWNTVQKLADLTAP
ncbi:DUF1697 domain-containing protein [Phenylobacterium soli]|uniref:DUF1697 domain-containing protein n=1 Tax=Phenylobacterium soli TaxID=2170551 RepID=A0A328ANX2_9CAUL|nr:DUF1697 domain-containing protein [Phenylobacterium soli]RAK56011.1 DUF1697 domain-containing protein [Phenylobacterium soli]